MRGGIEGAAKSPGHDSIDPVTASINALCRVFLIEARSIEGTAMAVIAALGFNVLANETAGTRYFGTP